MPSRNSQACKNKHVQKKESRQWKSGTEISFLQASEERFYFFLKPFIHLIFVFLKLFILPFLMNIRLIRSSIFRLLLLILVKRWSNTRKEWNVSYQGKSSKSSIIRIHYHFAQVIMDQPTVEMHGILPEWRTTPTAGFWSLLQSNLRWQRTEKGEDIKG